MEWAALAVALVALVIALLALAYAFGTSEQLRREGRTRDRNRA
jgi:Tfp pilus assembly protein PilX